MKKRLVFSIFLFLFLISFASATTFSNYWKSMTGEITAEDCVCVKVDLNFDEIIDVNDLTIIADCINQKENCAFNLADINSDGKVDNSDLSFYNDCHRVEIPEVCWSGEFEKKEKVKTATGKVIYVYANGQRIAKEENNELNYYHNDNLGSPRVVTDSDGNVVERIDYLPFGSEITDSNEKIKYNSKELDEDTGLLYYGARYYDSASGRFITADSVKGKIEDPLSLNLYSYVKNNPVKYVDLKGELV